MERVRRIERRAAVLLLLSLWVASLLGDPRVRLGLGVGGLLELANFHALAFLISRIIDGTSPDKAALIGLALAGKLVVLGVCIFVALQTLPVHPGALIVGISLVVVAIVAEGFVPDRRRRGSRRSW